MGAPWYLVTLACVMAGIVRGGGGGEGGEEGVSRGESPRLERDTNVAMIAGACGGSRILVGEAGGGWYPSTNSWGLDGRLRESFLFFDVRTSRRVNRVRLKTGGEDREDRRVTAFRLWVKGGEDESFRQEWCGNAQRFIPEDDGWEILSSFQHEAAGISTYNGRVFLHERRVAELQFPPRRISALLLKVDAVYDLSHRKGNRTHLPDATRADIVDLQVLEAGEEEEEEEEGEGGKGRARTGGSQTAPSMRADGLDLQTFLHEMSKGRWIFNAEGDGDGSSYDHCAAADWQAGSKTISGRRSNMHEDRGGWGGEDLCKDLGGLEIEMFGDTRMRHLFLSVMTSLEPPGHLLGFANPFRRMLHGASDRGLFAKHEGDEKCAGRTKRGTELLCAGAVPRLEEDEQGEEGEEMKDEEGRGSARKGSRRALGDRDGELAGVEENFRRWAKGEDEVRSQGWEKILCEGTVLVRLVESNDTSFLLRSMNRSLIRRRTCEDEDLCEFDSYVQVASIIVPDIVHNDFRTGNPVKPLQEVAAKEFGVRTMNLWRKEEEEEEEEEEERGQSRWRQHTSVRRTLSLWSSMEPFTMRNADTSLLNLQVASINSFLARELASRSLPLLDSHSFFAERSGCCVDGHHWGGSPQLVRTRVLLEASRRFKGHVRSFLKSQRTRRERLSSFRRMSSFAARILSRSSLLLDLFHRLLDLHAPPPVFLVAQGAGAGAGAGAGIGGSSRPCKRISGSEEGSWYPLEDGTYAYRLHACSLVRFSSTSARKCLQGKHLLLVGDSVMRYQYMSLASLLHQHYPERTGNEDEGRSNVCMPGLVWGTWRRFYLESSRSFQGRELCDCFRPEGPWSPEFEMRVEENRFLSLPPPSNLSLSYLQVFGGFPMHGHFPGTCRQRSSSSSSSSSFPCSFHNLSRASIAAATKVLSEEEYDRNPQLDTGSFFDWQGDVPTVLEHVAAALEPDLLVFNTGLWGELKEEDYVEDVFAAGSRAVGEGGRCFWKRTTKRFKCSGGSRRCERRTWVAEEVEDTVPLRKAEEMGWQVYDTAAPTRELEQDSFADGIHPRPYVYEELNNLLLNVLCNED